MTVFSQRLVPHKMLILERGILLPGTDTQEHIVFSLTPGWNQAQDQLCSLLVEGSPLETVHVSVWGLKAVPLCP